MTGVQTCALPISSESAAPGDASVSVAAFDAESLIVPVFSSSEFVPL